MQRAGRAVSRYPVWHAAGLCLAVALAASPGHGRESSSQPHPGRPLLQRQQHSELVKKAAMCKALAVLCQNNQSGMRLASA